MKIVMISTYPPQGAKHANEGGVASYTRNLVENINLSSDDELFILCNKTESQPSQYQEGDRHIIRCFDKNFKFMWQLLREVHRLNPQVIHIQQELSLYGGIVTALLLQVLLLLLARYKTVITLHGVVGLNEINADFARENFSHLPPLIIKLAFMVIYKPLTIWADRVLVHEQYFRNILIADYKVRASKILVIPHGVESFHTIPKPEACRRLALDAKKDIILFMGYLTGYKGLDLLIDGFAKYAKQNHDAYLIIGAGLHPKLKDEVEYRQEYERIQKHAEADIPHDQYKWVGFIPEDQIGLYYSAADISVYPYTIAMSSSGPMAIAIGHSKPFIASSEFEHILPSEVIFKKDAVSLANQLLTFFGNTQDYFHLATRLKQERNWQRVSAQTLEAYRGLAHET